MSVPVFNPVVPPNPNAIQIPDITSLGLSALAGAVSNLGKGLEKYRAIKSLGPQADLLGQITGNPQLASMLKMNAEAAIKAGADPGAVLSGMGDLAANWAQTNNEFGQRKDLAGYEYDRRAELQSSADRAAMDRITTTGAIDIGQAAQQHAYNLTEDAANNSADIQQAQIGAEKTKAYAEAMEKVATIGDEKTVNMNYGGVGGRGGSVTPTTDMFTRFLIEQNPPQQASETGTVSPNQKDNPGGGRVLNSGEYQMGPLPGGLPGASPDLFPLPNGPAGEISKKDAEIADKIRSFGDILMPNDESGYNQKVLGSMGELIKGADNPNAVLGRVREAEANENYIIERITGLQERRGKVQEEIDVETDIEKRTQLQKNLLEIEKEIAETQGGNRNLPPQNWQDAIFPPNAPSGTTKTGSRSDQVAPGPAVKTNPNEAGAKFAVMPGGKRMRIVREEVMDGRKGYYVIVDEATGATNWYDAADIPLIQ